MARQAVRSPASQRSNRHLCS